MFGCESRALSASGSPVQGNWMGNSRLTASCYRSCTTLGRYVLVGCRIHYNATNASSSASLVSCSLSILFYLQNPHALNVPRPDSRREERNAVCQSMPMPMQKGIRGKTQNPLQNPKPRCNRTLRIFRDPETPCSRHPTLRFCHPIQCL